MLSLGRSHKVRFLNNGEKNGVYFDAGIEFVGRICYPIRTSWRRCPILLPRKYVSFKPYLTAHLYSYRNKCACIRQHGIPGGVHEGFNVDRKPVVRSKRPSASARIQHRSHGNVVQHDGHCSAGA